MKKEPKIEICERCERKFARKYVPSRKDYSVIYSISHWTNGNLWNGYDVVCGNCLEDWYKNDKKSYNSLIDKNKKGTFHTYYFKGTIERFEKT